MARRVHVVLLDNEDFDSRAGRERKVDVQLRLQVPFEVEQKGMHDDDELYDDDDVIVRGPVYVGSDDMLDRHNELVAPTAIMNAWEGYSKNPVILYNHSKEAGVIGRMLSVEMGEWDGVEGAVPIGRALIDGGEEAIVRKIRKGMLKAFSIGFIARAAIKECDEDDSETCWMTFTEIDWLETSVVDVPASPNALFHVEKHIIGYEDFGDSIAILFEKEQYDEEPEVEEPEVEVPVEESGWDFSNKAPCTCAPAPAHTHEAGEHIESDTASLADLRTQIEELTNRLIALEVEENSQLSEYAKADSLLTPLADSTRQPMGTETMSEQEVIDAATEDSDVLEPVVEEVVEEPVLVEEPTNTKSDDEAEAKPDEPDDEVEEVEVEEESDDEAAVEEVVEATEEEAAPPSTTTEVLVEVVKSLVGIESRLGNIEKHIQVSDEVEALKAQIAELTTEKETAEAEAQIEVEVSKRVAALVGEDVIQKVHEADPKSLAASTPIVKSNKNLLDPQPVASEGMNGLANWLESQILARGD